MSRLARMAWLWACLAIVVAGCADNPMVLQSKLNQAQQQQVAMSRQYEQLQDRANTLDRDNRDMHAMLAQAQQQAKLSEDQVGAMRDQFRSLTAQVAQYRADKENADRRVQAVTTSMQRQGGVSIGANNSFLQTLPAMNIREVGVRRGDGDVIRIELPDAALFETGTARLRPGASNLICDVAGEILRTYPDQIIGIEGHTDTDPIAGGQWHNNHELSIYRALTVYDVLVTRTRLQANQLFVSGRGGNNPLVSNATPEGKQRNRRVELVIYPERKS